MKQQSTDYLIFLGGTKAKRRIRRIKSSLNFTVFAIDYKSLKIAKITIFHFRKIHLPMKI